MTLIVSLRIPDGIVIAGDSLSTMMASMEIQGDFDVECPECGHEHVISSKLSPTPIPSSTLSYAQKVFPFMEDFGVGTFGAGLLAGKTMYFAIRELEAELKGEGKEIDDVNAAAQFIGERAHELLLTQMQRDGLDVAQAPDGWMPLGFQIVGYNDSKATTVEVGIGKDITIQILEGPGCTVSGQHDVFRALANIYETDPRQRPVLDVFSLQDAIDYAEFLIGTTASHQKFSRVMPGVGGDIDVALVTPFDKFTWIRRKELLGKILGG